MENKNVHRNITKRMILLFIVFFNVNFFSFSQEKLTCIFFDESHPNMNVHSFRAVFIYGINGEAFTVKKKDERQLLPKEIVDLINFTPIDTLIAYQKTIDIENDTTLIKDVHAKRKRIYMIVKEEDKYYLCKAYWTVYIRIPSVKIQDDGPWH